MERRETVIPADTVRYFPLQWDVMMFKDGEKVFDRPCGINEPLRTDAALTFDEYYVEFDGNLQVKVSYLIVEYDGEEFEEDHVVEYIKEI
jgi:hypothetical protein